MRALLSANARYAARARLLAGLTPGSIRRANALTMTLLGQTPGVARTKKGAVFLTENSALKGNDDFYPTRQTTWCVSSTLRDLFNHAKPHVVRIASDVSVRTGF